MIKNEELQRLIFEFIQRTPAFGQDTREVYEQKDLILNLLHKKFSQHLSYGLISRLNNEDIFELKNKKSIFIPVDYFKRRDLEFDSSYRSLYSSGTSKEGKSRVSMDKNDAMNQRIALSKILTTFFGNVRRPMLFLNSPFTASTSELTAAHAAYAGFSLLSSRNYFLEKNGSIVKEVFEFCKKFHEESPIIFGFTFKIYESILSEGFSLGNFPNLTVIHGGGWKKLEKISLSKKNFRTKIFETLGTRRVHDYYGMAEQTGGIYLECHEERYHVSNFSDIFVRDGSLGIINDGTHGIIQSISLLNSSYPAFSILTKDVGYLHYDKASDCPCGIPGKTVGVVGRINSAELRGCSDSLS